MGTSFVCPRCGNADLRYIGYKKGKPYCRRCISFNGESVIRKEGRPRPVVLDLAYRLSEEQNALSNRIVENFKNGIDTLVYAVCGSGKTEISYAVMAYAMSRGMKVAFALPRRDVVIELFFRLRDAFPGQRVIAVYGGHTSQLEGDLIVLTTHQLFRYPNYFDLLVMDEIDAFPFKGNEVLQSFYRRALRGHCLMMSATPSKAVVKEFRQPGKEMLTLHTRFHKHPIPVPKTVIKQGLLQTLFLIQKLRQYQKEGRQCFVFVPSVDLSESLFRRLSPFLKGGDYVSSKKADRDGTIQRFKEGKTRFLITTAVMERGITVKGLQVIVYHADDAIYDAAALIQIAGRAGRKADAPDGDVLFLGEKKTRAMEEAENEIRYCNTFLQKMLQKD